MASQVQRIVQRLVKREKREKRDNTVDPSDKYLREVERRKAQIREGWSDAEHYRRAGQQVPGSYEIPMMREPKRS